MTRLERVIETVKESRTGKNHAWIFDDNGNISNEAICGDVFYLLEELKEYEINVSDEFIHNFFNNKDIHSMYTYNVNANISNDINVDYIITKYNECIMLIMVHLGGDARANFTEHFAVKFRDEFEFFELESMRQSVYINDRFVADINLLSETYPVYDYETSDYIGDFYEIEREDLLREIEKISENNF